MNRRNWLDLSRKLVDRFDLDYTENSLESGINALAIDYYGKGVVQTPAYPTGLEVTLSGVTLTCSVSAGVAYDVNGNRIFTAAPMVAALTADPLLPRKAYIVAIYKKTGITPVPKPSNPIQNVFLNLIDDLDIVAVLGAPNIAPEYPAMEPQFVILAGVLIPAAAAVGTDCTLDDSVREHGIPVASRVLWQENPVGVIDGVNRDFLLTKQPVDDNSIIFSIDGSLVEKADYTYDRDTNVVRLAIGSTPQPGQSVYTAYLIGQTGAISPVTGAGAGGGSLFQEQPTGVVNGINTVFQLSEIPINPESVVLTIDGLMVNKADFTVDGQTINFVAGMQPKLGQELYSAYLIGATSVIAGGGAAGYTPSGTGAAPNQVDPVVGVVIGLQARQVRFVTSLGGAQPVTANPQVQAGTTIGQELVLIGGSNVDYISLADGSGLLLNGGIDLKKGSVIILLWDGTVWNELSRR